MLLYVIVWLYDGYIKVAIIYDCSGYKICNNISAVLYISISYHAYLALVDISVSFLVLTCNN